MRCHGASVSRLDVGMRTDSADVVIVGSGMGGGTLAWGLARRGIKVLVVERGDYLPREPQNWSPTEVFKNRRYKPDERWLDEGGGEFRPGVHYLVGGNTKVYGASLPRLRECDFAEIKFPTGISRAWPFPYADIEPYYSQAESLYRVHGATGEDPTEPWRSQQFPYPALSHEPYIQGVIDRLGQQGVHPSATAMGVDLQAGGACIRCGTCDGFPCRVGAKSDSETCALEPALAGGFVRLLTNTRIDHLETGGTDQVVWLVGECAGEPIWITGGAYVLAAGAANTAALLLRSRDDRWPNGVGNSNDLVGRNYMMHNNTHLAAIDPRRRNDVVFQKTFAINDFYFDMGDGYPGGSIQLIGKVQGSMMKTHATRAPLPLLNEFSKRSLELLVMAEDLPSPQNRVSVTQSGQIAVRWKRTNYDRHELLLAETKRLLRQIGYLGIFEQRFTIDMNSHMCGTAVGGTDPAQSVVDGLGRSHEVANLFIADAAFFPSSGAQNPALTIAALALRMAAEVEWA